MGTVDIESALVEATVPRPQKRIHTGGSFLLRCQSALVTIGPNEPAVEPLLCISERFYQQPVGGSVPPLGQQGGRPTCCSLPFFVCLLLTSAVLTPDRHLSGRRPRVSCALSFILRANELRRCEGTARPMTTATKSSSPQERPLRRRVRPAPKRSDSSVELVLSEEESQFLGEISEWEKRSAESEIALGDSAAEQR